MKLLSLVEVGWGHRPAAAGLWPEERLSGSETGVPQRRLAAVPFTQRLMYGKLSVMR